MLRRATRGALFLARSRLKNLCENVLPEERFSQLYPPPVDPIKEKTKIRINFQNAVKLLTVSARNKKSNVSRELSEVEAWTKEDVDSGELSTEQLMYLAKLRFNGQPGGKEDEKRAHQVKQDAELAVHAWIQASKRGNTAASYSVAFCLLNGIGIEKDEEEAFQLMFPLANSYNNPYAHYAMGNMYLKGLGTNKDEKLAFLHYKAAAEEGIPPAIYNLGNMYAAGVGVKQSDENAVACYEGAARFGDLEAKYILGTWLCEGRGVAAGNNNGIKDDKYSSNFDRGIALQVEAAAAGHARAAYNIGVFYLEGRHAKDGQSGEINSKGIQQDLASAAIWFEKASHLGMCEASFNLGMMYLEGSTATPQDLYKARDLFRKGTQQNKKNEACFVLLNDVEKLIRDVEGKKGSE